MSGATRIVNGSLLGTGAARDVKTVGFRPTMVEVFNAGGLCWAVWTSEMADASCLKFITDGTMSAVTTNGITPLADGFTLGADTDLNVSGEKVYWIAYD